jgi:hypothetical protein
MSDLRKQLLTAFINCENVKVDEILKSVEKDTDENKSLHMYVKKARLTCESDDWNNYNNMCFSTDFETVKSFFGKINFSKLNLVKGEYEEFLLDIYHKDIIENEINEEKIICEIYENFETFFNADIIAIKLMIKCLCSKRFGYCNKLVDRVFGIKKFTYKSFSALCSMLSFNELSGNFLSNKYLDVCEIYDFFKYKDLITLPTYELLVMYFMYISNTEILFKFLHLAICKGTKNKCIQMLYAQFIISNNGGIDIFINKPTKDETISDDYITIKKPQIRFENNTFNFDCSFKKFFIFHQ